MSTPHSRSQRARRASIRSAARRGASELTSIADKSATTQQILLTSISTDPLSQDGQERDVLPFWASAQTQKRQHHQDPRGDSKYGRKASRGTRTCPLGNGRRNSSALVSEEARPVGILRPVGELLYEPRELFRRS